MNLHCIRQDRSYGGWGQMQKPFPQSYPVGGDTHEGNLHPPLCNVVHTSIRYLIKQLQMGSLAH